MRKHPYVVILTNPDDEYTAFNGQELPDGSLSYMDSAGIPHTAPPGTWRKRTEEETD